MKKLILPLLLCVILLFSGCTARENRVRPPFFKITDPETDGTAYLLGTMHVGTANTVYPDEIYAALRECSTLAVELDLQALEADQPRLSSAIRILECKNGSASVYLGEDYAEIKKFFQEKQIYNRNLELYIPAMWNSTLSTKLAADCGYSSAYGTDRAMLTYAKKHSMKIVELESVEQQYQVNANEPPELQIYSLKSSIQTDYEILKDQMKELYRAWSENDTAALERMLTDEEIPEELSDEYAQYYYEMYENRQKNMAEYIAQSLKNGDKVFVAVGAMHCCAPPDILDLLDGKFVIEQIKYDSPLT